MNRFNLLLAFCLVVAANSYAETLKERNARIKHEDALLAQDSEYLQLKADTISLARTIYGEKDGLIHQLEKAKARNPCVKQEMQFSDIPSGEATDKYIDQLRGKIKPSSQPQPSKPINSKCPSELADVLELDKKVDAAITKMYITQFKLYLQKYKVLSHIKSDQAAYIELNAALQSALKNSAIKDLNLNARAEIRAKAKEFLDKAKNSSTVAGLNTCTSESCVQGPIKGLNALIEKLEKIH